MQQEYNNLTIKLLEEGDRINYEQVAESVREISKSGMFGA